MENSIFGQYDGVIEALMGHFIFLSVFLIKIQNQGH